MTAPVVGRSLSYDQYVEEHQSLVAAALALIQIYLAPFRPLALPLTAWTHLLALIYPVVEDYRQRSGELAREFYDSERRDKTGIVNPHPFFLAEYEPDWFEEALTPVREIFSRADATIDDEAQVLSAVAKQIENGGRRTTLRAVEDDPEVVGWARVQGGEDSCAFCTMLISRGPVYLGADTAGLDLDDTSAVEIWRQAQLSEDNSELDELMTRWHPNCDCKVVPVFNRASWPGRDQYLEALDLWKQATANGEKGRDALNSLRRLITRRQDDEGQPLPQAA